MYICERLMPRLCEDATPERTQRRAAVIWGYITLFDLFKNKDRWLPRVKEARRVRIGGLRIRPRISNPADSAPNGAKGADMRATTRNK